MLQGHKAGSSNKHKQNILAYLTVYMLGLSFEYSQYGLNLAFPYTNTRLFLTYRSSLTRSLL